jgi:uncharacterized SAM-binding protein YcdF (DUF218 family)
MLARVATYLVIFGAAVRADGSPSGTLARRVEGAVAAGRTLPGARYMPTGGRGATGFVEAEVMRAMLLAAGVPAYSIVPEDAARDTLESVRLCDALLRRAGDCDRVVPCTSRYHLPRCAVLFRLAGWQVQVPAMPGDAGRLPWRKLLWYHLKEAAALPYDAALLLGARAWRAERDRTGSAD